MEQWNVIKETDEAAFMFHVFLARNIMLTFGIIISLIVLITGLFFIPEYYVSLTADGKKINIIQSGFDLVGSAGLARYR